MIYKVLWVTAFDAGKSIMRASGRELGPGKPDFFGPCEMASSREACAIWGPKCQDFQDPTPLPTCSSTGFARITSIVSEVHR